MTVSVAGVDLGMDESATDETSRSVPLMAASQRAAAYLRDAILSGQIKPGERLPQEEIAERLGSSRLPVREALRILELEGLTEHAANKGARVPALGARQVDLIYQMRERLEPLALTESMPNLREVDVARLLQIQDVIEESSDIGDFLMLDREFHLLTYSGCEMEPLRSTVVRLWNSTQHYRRLFMNLAGPEKRWIVNAEHKLLLDAIRRADPVGAGVCLEAHIRRTRIALAQHPEVFSAYDR